MEKFGIWMDRIMIEITPFTRIVWKTNVAKNKWNDKINAISTMYARCELETVKNGMRRATTWHMDMNNLSQTFDMINNHGLIFTPIAQSGYYEGFSHCHRPVIPGKPSYWYGSLTKTVEDGELFKTASNEKEQDAVHIPIGELLGYPKCCTDKFISIWKTGNYDGMYEIAEQTEDVDITCRDSAKVCTIHDIGKYSINSPLLRYFGIRAIAHFPCSLKCKESYTVAQKWLKVMDTIDPDASNDLKELLSSVISWDSLNGVVEVDTPYFKGITHTYPYLGQHRIINITRSQHSSQVDN
jgi:hypothetical protein